jgi:hypothetical protein
MNSKTKTELLVKLKEMNSYPDPKEFAAIVTAVVEVLPDELFEDAERKAQPGAAEKKEGEQAFTPPAQQPQPQS